ncbi:HypC/HybG/HupF family hydrogenase formation chaperone [Meiothermus cerbereus]|uniref:HypC/HybG/HupF family hydrogenase formation chaperone n=1 Tax=Meiothermus cerbereus TaxID=65552 RepID=UPI003EEA4FFF
MCLAIPGKVVQFNDEFHHFATVEVSGVRRQVNLDLLSQEEVSLGDWVLIHVGFAMSKISETQAMEQLDLLTRLGEADAALEELEGYQFAEEEQRPDAPS